jgi:predicted RNA-binding protein
MCESKAYILKGGTEDLIVESVETLEVSNGQVKIRSLFGDEHILKARVKTLSLVDHKIVLEPP